MRPRNAYSAVRRRRLLLVPVLVLGGALGLGCHGLVGPSQPSRRGPGVAAPLGVEEIAAVLPARVRQRPLGSPSGDAREWSDAIFNALASVGLPGDQPAVCQVVAIIGQESGFEADPAIPGLAQLVEARLERTRARLGPLGAPVLARLLSGRSPDDVRAFEERLALVRTERDVDVLFRDIVAYHEVNHPALYATANLAGKLFDVRALEELNPITTAGPMQVSVRFAEAWAREHKGKTTTPAEVRDALYTRRSGVYYGTARLLGWPARYEEPLFRFADYNAGVFASRNAALQADLARLTGLPLAADGDLLAYEKDGTPKDEDSQSARAVKAFARQHAPTLTDDQIRRDLATEKTLAFEGTPTYGAIRSAAARLLGRPPTYAVLPQVAITSPKFSGTRSTAWFARSVERRYRACLAASPAPS